MANFLQTVRDLLTKVGLSETNETVAALLQSEKVKALESVEIDPTICNLLTQKLITIGGAKSHGDVSAHFKKSYFDTIDAALKASLQELGIPDETIAEIEKNPTDKRINAALQKVIEIKGKATSNQEIETLRNTLKLFQESAKSEKERIENELRASQSQLKDLHKNYAIKGALNKYNFIETLTRDQIDLLLQNEINTQLAQRKALLQYENGNFALKSAENPELDYFDTKKGKPVPFHEMLDEIVANSKLQKTAEQPGGNGNNGGNGNAQKFQTGNTDMPANRSKFLERFAKPE